MNECYVCVCVYISYYFVVPFGLEYVYYFLFVNTICFWRMLHMQNTCMNPGETVTSVWLVVRRRLDEAMSGGVTIYERLSIMCKLSLRRKVRKKSVNSQSATTIRRR